jgi:hypothetical protein
MDNSEAEGGGGFTSVQAEHFSRGLQDITKGLRNQNALLTSQSATDGEYLKKLSSAEDEKKRKQNLAEFKETIGETVSQDEVNMVSAIRCFDMARGIGIGIDMQRTDLFNALMDATKMNRANPKNPLRDFRGGIDARLAALAVRGHLLGEQGGPSAIGTRAFMPLDDEALQNVHRLNQAQLNTKPPSAGKTAPSPPRSPQE